jgi:hypothetical protein
MSNPNRDTTNLSIPDAIPAGQEGVVLYVSAVAARQQHGGIGTRLAASVRYLWPAADCPVLVPPITGAAQHVRSAISDPTAALQSP